VTLVMGPPQWSCARAWGKKDEHPPVTQLGGDRQKKAVKPVVRVWEDTKVKGRTGKAPGSLEKGENYLAAGTREFLGDEEVKKDSNSSML